MGEFRKRILMPAALPLAAAGVIGILTLAFSRVLLAVPEAGSTILAMLLAAMVLAVAGVLAATGSSLKPSQKAIAGFAGLAVLGAGIGGAALGVREIEHEAEEIEIAAENIEFDTDTLHLPPDEPVNLVFHNNDEGVPHNVEIYPDDTFSGEATFEGEVFNGVATVTYEIEPIAAGTYAFRCVIHPSMEGDVTVGEDGEGPSPDGGPPADETVVGENIAFDKDPLELPADTEAILRFDNRDQGILHNVEIYPDDSFSGDPLFKGETFPGLEVRDYEIPAIPAGEYAFRCVVHPTQMLGTVRFE